MDKNAGADAIYYVGPIVTMIQNGHRVETLAVLNGNIPAVGSLKEVMAKKRAGPIE